MQDIDALPRLATKLLPKQDCDIGLVIDNQDANRHDLATHAEEVQRALGAEAARQTDREFGEVSDLLETSIVPPCCLVTIS